MNDAGSSGPDRLRRLSVGDSDTRELRVQVSVSGGMPSERMQLDAEMTGDGHLEGQINDPITNQVGSFDGQVSDEQLRELIALVASDDFARQPQEPPMFPPDTTVASIEISIGGEPVGTYLTAVDPDQVAGTDAEAQQPTNQLLTTILTSAEAMVSNGSADS